MGKKLCLLLAVMALSCAPADQVIEGVVLEKEYRPSEIQLLFNGKTFVPHPIPEKYILHLQDSTGKVKRIRVYKEIYDMCKVNDYVKYDSRRLD